MRATDRVIRWVHSTPELAADLRRVAEGNDYVYGDNDLAELVGDLIGPNPNILARNYLSSKGVREADARTAGEEVEAIGGEDWVDVVAWVEVREALLKGGE